MKGNGLKVEIEYGLYMEINPRVCEPGRLVELLFPKLKDEPDEKEA